MRIQICVAALAVALTTISCKKELEPQDSSSDTAVAQSESTMPAPASPESAVQQQPDQTVQAQAQVPQMTTSQPAPVAAGMNPAHGQPGHRCDIPVGAPLNSPQGTAAPRQSTSQVVGSDPNIKVTPAQLNADGTLSPKGQAPSTAPAILQDAAASTTAPGMNPPHGQPGHRCDIAVGQPLQ